MANEWRTLMSRVNRIMLLRTQLQDHDSPADQIKKPDDMPRWLFKRRLRRLIETEAEFPAIAEAAFSTGPERNRRTKDEL